MSGVEAAGDRVRTKKTARIASTTEFLRCLHKDLPTFGAVIVFMRFSSAESYNCEPKEKSFAGGRLTKDTILVVAEDRAIREFMLRLAAAARPAEADLPNSQGSLPPGRKGAIANHGVSAALPTLRSNDPLILIASQRSETSAVETLRSGTTCLRLPLTPAGLTHAVDALVHPSVPSSGGNHILGASQKIQEVRRYLYRVAACSSNVLITGETGTGCGFVELQYAEYLR